MYSKRAFLTCHLVLYLAIPKNFSRLFSLNQIFTTNTILLNKKKGQIITEVDKALLKEFWSELTSSVIEWKLVFDRKLTSTELEANYIVAHGIFLEAVGIVGRYLYENKHSEWKFYVRQLSGIDWDRKNTTDWLGRAFSPTGRINKNKYTIQLTSNMIKKKLYLPLQEDEQRLENTFQAEHS